jgi:hypothetical protein
MRRDESGNDPFGPGTDTAVVRTCGLFFKKPTQGTNPAMFLRLAGPIPIALKDVSLIKPNERGFHDIG